MACVSAHPYILFDRLSVLEIALGRSHACLSVRSLPLTPIQLPFIHLLADLSPHLLLHRLGYLFGCPHTRSTLICLLGH